MKYNIEKIKCRENDIEKNIEKLKYREKYGPAVMREVAGAQDIEFLNFNHLQSR